MQIESFAISDTGRVRKVNEDSFLVNEQEGIFLVADGLGGLSKGNVASSKAVQIIEDFVVRSRRKDIPWPCVPCEGLCAEENRFLAAIHLANKEIFAEFQEDPKDFVGMGTTLTGLLFHRDEVIVANVGDSRVYQIRGGSMIQVTEDHSLVMEEVKKGYLSAEEARYHPQKHVLTQALGVAEEISVDISTYPVQDGDLYLLCSDGLTDLMTDEEIMELVQSQGEPALPALGEELIRTANERGGIDNVTVLLVKFCAESRAKNSHNLRSDAQ